MGSERAVIEEEEKVLSPMQLNSPSNVAMDADNLDDNDMDDSSDAGGGAGQPMSQEQLQQIKPLIRGRGPSLIVDREQEDDSDDDGERQRHVSNAPLIEEEKAAQAPALDKSKLMKDIWGARELQEEVGANPYRGLIEAGEVLQGGANAARRRGEGRYGAAAWHSLGGLAVSAANSEGASAAGNAAKTALKPLTAAALPATLAKDAAKYTVGNLISTAGQAVQKVGDSKRDAADPEGILENQRLIDLKNQHEFGYDATSTEMGRTREQEVAERGVRFEKDDNAKRIWEGPKKRTWGRIAQNAVAAPFRGIGKAFKGLVTSPAAAFKSMVNPIAKYGRKFGNWVSNNSWNRKRRANNALERLRARTDPNNANPHPAEAEGALKADSPLGKNRMLNFRGADAAIRSHTRDVRQAQGFDNILGQKDYEKLNQADRVDYRERERALLTSSPKYANMADSFTQDSDQIRSIAQQFDVKPAAAQGQQDQAQQNQPPLIGDGGEDFENLEEKDAPRHGEPELAKDSHAGASAVEGIDKAVKFGAKFALDIPKKAAPVVEGITNVLSTTVPDMLEGQTLEDYAPIAEGANAFGEGYKNYNAGAAMYRAPLIAEGLGTAADLFRTANQYRNRDKDPNETALNERRTLEDTREMSNRVRALLQAKKDSGASEESIARTKRLRNKMMMHRLVTANRKLAKAQEMNGITPLNEYTKNESDFIDTGEYTKDKEVGAKGGGELVKEFGKSTKKMFGAYAGGTNTADSKSEAERLYPPNRDEDDADDADDAVANPQIVNAGAHQNVIEEIEDEEKHASGELSAGGDSFQDPGDAGSERPVSSNVEMIDTSGGDSSSLPQGVPDNGEQEAAFDRAFGSSARENYHTFKQGAAPDGHLTAAGQGYFPVRPPAPFDPYVAEERLVSQKQDMEQQLANLPSGEAADIADAEALRAHRSRREDYDARLEEFEKADPGAFMGPQAAYEGGYDSGGEDRMAAWDQANPRPERPNRIHDQRVALQGGISKLSNPKEQVAQNWSAHQNGVETYRRRQEYLSRYAPGSADLNPDMDGYENQQVGDAALYDTYRQGLPRLVPPAREEERVEAQQPERQIPARVVDDFQQQPMGGQGPQGPALGNGPMLNQSVAGQWQMMQEEEKGAVGGPPRPVHGVGAEMLDTSAGGVGRSDMLMDPRELALLRNAADPSRAARQLPAIKETVAKAQGAQTKDDATSGWRQVDRLQRGMVNRRWSQSGLASREGLAAADARQARRDDLLGRAPLIDASTRHEGLELPEAQVEDRRLEAGGDDQNRLKEFNMPGDEFNIAEHGADDSDEALHRAMHYPEVYLPKIVDRVGRDEAKKKIKYAFERRDPKQRQGIQRMDLQITNRLNRNIDMKTKRPLFGDPKANGKFDSVPTEDARAHMGPMTVDDREVVPEFPGGVKPIERQGEERQLYGRHYLKPFGGKWRDKETNQVVQTALTTGDDAQRDVNNPFSAANAIDHKEMHYDPIAPEKLVNAPAAGWGNIGKKPWWFARKKAKEEYKQKTKAIDPVIDDAWEKMKGEAMPPFMKGVPYAEKKWREKEREQRELAAALRRKLVMGADQLHRL